MNTAIINKALLNTTGNTVSNVAIMNAGNSAVQVAKTFSNNSLPVHFNEVKEGSREDVKNGFILITENDAISYNGSFYEGINTIYSGSEIAKIIRNENTVVVK